MLCMTECGNKTWRAEPRSRHAQHDLRNCRDASTASLANQTKNAALDLSVAFLYSTDATDLCLSQLFQRVERLADLIGASKRIGEPLHFQKLFNGHDHSGGRPGGDMHHMRP